MVKIRRTNQQKNVASPKGEVGEIDTRAPFESVKAAVTLFREFVALSQEKATTRKSRLCFESVLNKEAQLMLLRREIERHKLHIETAETTKARANSELEKAKATLNDLTTKLSSVNQSRSLAIQVAEAIEKQDKHIENAARKQQLGQEREQYITLAAQLDSAKQELAKVRQDFDAALDAKSASFHQAAEAQRLANLNAERVNELVTEIRAMQESNQRLTLASLQAQEQVAQVIKQKEQYIQSCKAAKAEVDKKLEASRKGHHPEITRTLEVKLVETTVGIEALQEEMRKAHAFEMNAVKFITTELNGATKILQEVVGKEGLLRNIVTSLKLELDEVKKVKIEMQMREVKEFFIEKRTDSDGLNDEQRSMLQKLATETEIARREEEEIKKKTNKLKHETGKGKSKVEEVNKKLEIVLAMVEQAKEREKRARDEMKILSEKRKSENYKDTIKMSLKEFEILKQKVEECDNVVVAKETEAMAEVEAIIGRKKISEEKIQENLIAIEEIKEATDMALKSAEMAEAAQVVVEGELDRWRQDDPPVIST